ncbi:orexin receptor type 2-like [Mizuhopecten yessoensis]|uniref:orexin receptor type 2-like n=1 Tax=Mizuhopecten yessoensis TaxID=6573 RepID=UPI000B45B901|nr:orexin receptor type 2-like [Mizuhopecten yessoensis]
MELKNVGVSIVYNVVDTVEPCVNTCLSLTGCVSTETCRKYIEDYIFPRPLEWAFIAVYGILFLFGLIGNALVCYVICHSHHMQTVVNIFIFNLAVADFLVIFFCLPTTMLADITETWYFGDIMCKIIPFLQTTSVSVSVLTLSAISVERYFAICQPLKVRLTTRTIIKIIVAIWIAGMAASVPEVLFNRLWESVPGQVTKYLVHCRKDWSLVYDNNYQLFILVALYSIPICLMAFTYSVISRQLWKNDIPGTAETNHVCSRSGSTISGPESQLHSRRRAAKMLMTIVVIFAVCYLPVHILNLIRFTDSFRGVDETIIINIALISHILCYVNSAINPVIYNFMSAKFRKEFRMTLTCCRCRRRQSSSLVPPGTTSSARNRSSIPRTERFTMNTVTMKQPGWITSPRYSTGSEKGNHIRVTSTR